MRQLLVQHARILRRHTALGQLAQRSTQAVDLDQLHRRCCRIRDLSCLLPAVTLHFFCSFPRESLLLQGRKYLTPLVIYVPSALMAVLVAFTYWTACMLNGASAGEGQLTDFQKLVADQDALDKALR